MRDPTVLSPTRPYLLWVLDGVLANYAGVSPEEPIGEPRYYAWNLLHEAQQKGYDSIILTWREVGIVVAWMERAKLDPLLQGFGLQITNSMPVGLPRLWITADPNDNTSQAEHLERLIRTLPDRREK